MVPAPGHFTCTCVRCANAEELKASQGQGLVAAMAEVPAPFFQEGFDIDQAALWEQVVQVGWGCSGPQRCQEPQKRCGRWLNERRPGDAVQGAPLVAC